MGRTRADAEGRAWSPEAAPYGTSWRDTRWKSGQYELGGVFGQFMARKLDEAILEAGQVIAWHDSGTASEAQS